MGQGVRAAWGPSAAHPPLPAPSHVQGWAERSIFGKIRYMNYAGCKRKFNIDAYISCVAKARRVRAGPRFLCVVCEGPGGPGGVPQGTSDSAPHPEPHSAICPQEEEAARKQAGGAGAAAAVGAKRPAAAGDEAGPSKKAK